MNYSDQQMMLLEQLTYLNDDVYKNIQARKTEDSASQKIPDTREMNSVEQIVNSFSDEDLAILQSMGSECITNDDGNSTHVSGAEWASIIKQIKQDDDLTSLKISNTTSVSVDGDGYNVDAMTFHQSGNKKDAIVCFRGTLNGEEWRDDAEYLELTETDCNQKALFYINNLPYSNIAVVGHSKGGNKAAHVYYNSNKVSYCVAMDAPGNPPEYYYQNIEQIKKKKGTIKCYSLEADYVNLLMLPFPDAEYIYCKGFGVDGYAENHCPNCFFEIRYGEMGWIEGVWGIQEGKQTEASKLLHNFTAFIGTEMSYGNRVKTSDYLGNILKMALGGEKHDADEIINELLSNPKELAKICAYWKKYCELYDIKKSDIVSLVSSILFNNNPKAKVEAVFIADAVAAISVSVPGIIPILLILGSKAGYKKNKKTIDLILEKLKAGELDNLIKLINEEYAKLAGIEKKDSLDYLTYTFRKYNYTKDAYEAIIAAIDAFEEVEFESTSIWTNYSEEDWFEDISGTKSQSALNSFMNQVPSLSSKCKTEFTSVFNTQWRIDNRYAKKMKSHIEKMDSCMNDFKGLRDRLETNMSSK